MSSPSRVPAHELVERALSLGSGPGCVVIVEDTAEVDVRFANNTTTTNGARNVRRVTIVTMRDAAAMSGFGVGVASRTGDPDVADLVAESEAAAACAPPADDVMPLMAGKVESGFVRPAGTTDLASLGTVVNELAEELARARSADHVLSGFVSHRVETTFLGTSTGLRRRHEQPTGSIELVARAAVAEGGPVRSAWTAAGTPTLVGVDLGAMHRRLEERLGWAQRRVELPAGRYDVILPPDATADLMVTLAEAMSGRDAEDGRNCFAAPGGGTRVGEQLSAVPVELRSDPSEPGLGCPPFFATGASGSDVSVFDNGLPLARTTWIEDGRLRHLRYHRAGAARAGTDPTPPIGNLVLEVPDAAGTLEEVVARTDRGLLLTCLWYIREVDPVTLLQTGLTRDGVYLVESGEVVGAVNNFRFNESPLALLSRIEDASVTERALSREWGEWMNRTAMPTLRVRDFNMSSVSPAV